MALIVCSTNLSKHGFHIYGQVSVRTSKPSHDAEPQTIWTSLQGDALVLGGTGGHANRTVTRTVGLCGCVWTIVENGTLDRGRETENVLVCVWAKVKHSTIERQRERERICMCVCHCGTWYYREWKNVYNYPNVIHGTIGRVRESQRDRDRANVFVCVP